MKLWLDDVRPAPDGWLWAKSVNEAIGLIELFERSYFCSCGMAKYFEEKPALRYKWLRQMLADSICVISLDHDLGDFASDGGDGIKLMDWLLERHTLYPLEFHTANPVGRENMQRMYRRYWLGECI